MNVDPSDVDIPPMYIASLLILGQKILIPAVPESNPNPVLKFVDVSPIKRIWPTLLVLAKSSNTLGVLFPIPILPLALTNNVVVPPNVSTSKTPPVEPLTCNLAVAIVVPIPIPLPLS